MRLGEYLLNQNILDKDQLIIALNEAEVTQDKVGEVLVRLGFLSRDELTKALIKIAPDAVIDNHFDNIKISQEFLKKTKTVIRGEMGKEICIVTLHPDTDYVLKEIQAATNKPVRLVDVSHNEILDSLKKYNTPIRKEKSYNNTEDVEKIIKSIIFESLKQNSTDIHIEVSDKTIHVKFRIDGILHDSHVLPSSLSEALFLKIKELSKMDTLEKNIPQDGSFSDIFRGRLIDFRVSTIPVIYGEKITIRIFDKEKIMLDINSLGITKINEWVNLSKLSNGLILICGTVGSGKTTTLYSTIMNIDRVKKAIYTIEDPIEYKLPFVVQSQIADSSHYTYSRFTKTVLRHDPDVIVISDIPDKETAKNIIHLADMGHLVYASLNTNDIISTINRLEMLGLSIEELSFALKGMIAQRLARKICPSCKGNGCEWCHMTGYSGRTLITEFVKIDSPNDLNKIISKEKTYHSFKDDAFMKVFSGITNCKEISRIFGCEIKLCNNLPNCRYKGTSKCA